MFQLPVNNLSRLRKARKRVKRLLSDIGLDYCKEHVKDFKEFGPDEFSIKHLYLDVCMWDPSWTKSQDYRTKQFCCSDCPFASKYFSAYKNHFRNVHREDFENRILLNCSYCMYSGNKWTLETHVRLFHMPHNLVRQGIASSHQAVVGGRDLQIHKSMFPDKNERPVYYCKKCNYRDRLYNVVRRHIYREHFQHVAAPYVTKSSEKQENNKMAQVSSHGLHCKSCFFVSRSYETLVQHVIEIHERTGHQVTAMIGHTSVTVAHSQTNLIQRGTTVPPGVSHHLVQPVNCINMPKVMGLLVGKQLKHTGKSGQPLSIMLPEKTLSCTVSQSHAGKRLGSLGFTSRRNASFSPTIKSLPLSSVHVGTATLTSLQAKKASANILNTSQTQNWKICIICNKLFPESVYSTHFEKEHQAKKVQAMAKYIMKIHSFTSKCLYCNIYLLSDSLLNHILVHGLACPQCHSTFYEVEKIIAHKQQAHLNEPEDHPTGSLLIFDLTFQHGNPKNVQLIVTTYSKKEAPELSFTTVQPPNSAIARSTMLANKGQDKFNEPLMRIASQRPQKKEAGKTLCPLCFTILKGPISDAFAHHLQNQHQVLQTLHPVEKKLTYRCIHCLGVYTSNMTASMIKLHLVHCRGAGQTSEIHCSKFISTLKRDIAASDTSYQKKRKLMNQGRYNPTIFVDKLEKPIVLALDPKGHADESYNARKSFLTSYFNIQPYPCQQEVEKLATSLWLWKSDVSNHFANNRQLCKEDFATRKPVVLLGFNMKAVNQLKHNISFDSKWVFTVSDMKKSEKARTSKIRLKSYGFSAEEGSDTQIKCACKPLLGSSLDSLTFESYGELEQAATFCSSVVQARIKGTVLKDNLIRKRDEKMSSNCTKGDAMCFDGSVYSSSPEETTWSGEMPPDKNTYSSAGRFEEKEKEVGLLGR
ncbi:activity-dependent neuroprotective protein a [Trichomycterus rosablanca]|uniref:activity-dependent neuroprotective protein a n=1 Tax=Trichomycterus rosablanca TaxID=2290929 RepID=UPI002F35BD98